MSDEGMEIFGLSGDDLPDGMKQALHDVMRTIKARHEKESGHDCNACRKGTCDCQQVAKLSGDALLKFKTSLANQSKVDRKGQMAVAQLELLKKQRDMLQAKRWDDIYEATGLNSSGDYHFCEDGRIMKRGGN